jgi:hypothetical protein
MFSYSSRNDLFDNIYEHENKDVSCTTSGKTGIED